MCYVKVLQRSMFICHIFICAIVKVSLVEKNFLPDQRMEEAKKYVGDGGDEKEKPDAEQTVASGTKETGDDASGAAAGGETGDDRKYVCARRAYAIRLQSDLSIRGGLATYNVQIVWCSTYISTSV